MAAQLKHLKQDPQTAWLSEVSSVSLQQALRHLDNAFTRFFKGEAEYPQFKSRKNDQSCSYMQNGFRFRDGQLSLAKQAAPLAIHWSRRLPVGAEPSSVTVTRTPAGRYYVSFLVEEDSAPLAPVTGEVGVDLNTHAVVDSRGRHHRVPLRLKTLERRKRRYQRACRRKVAAAKRSLGLGPKDRIPKGTRLPVSNNLRKARLKVGRAAERITNVRRDWQHQLTTSLVRENQVIAVEDLNVQAMSASAKGTAEKPGKHMKAKAGLNRSVLDVGFYEIRRQLAYKSAWHGRDFVAIDRWYPSSKRCSACGHILSHLALATRHWTCPVCETHHDRDVNAAHNILGAGKAILDGSDALRVHGPDSGARANQPGGNRG